jgi:hypothetical protein
MWHWTLKMLRLACRLWLSTWRGVLWLGCPLVVCGSVWMFCCSLVVKDASYSGAFGDLNAAEAVT